MHQFLHRALAMEEHEGLRGFNPGAPVDQRGESGSVVATNPLGLSSSTLDVLDRTDSKGECEEESSSRADLIAGVASSSDGFETPRGPGEVREGPPTP